MLVTPLAGVWIEIREGERGHVVGRCKVTPLAGVWIEIEYSLIWILLASLSHPSRVCGLKLAELLVGEVGNPCHTPRGCVD